MIPPEVRDLVSAANALIFDCDGTLVDTIGVYATAWDAGFALSGQLMEPPWYLSRAGMSETALMDEFELLHDIKLDRAETVREVRRQFLVHLHTLKEITTVADIARSRRGRCPMAVASGGPATIVKPSLEAAGLADLFEVVVTFDDVGVAKPQPDLFLEAARQLQVRPADCLVFEDSDQGLMAAKRAGMKVVNVADLRRR